jgi:hypothetical protein
MENVRGVLEELQSEGILEIDIDSVRLIDREKLFQLTETVGREQAASAGG